MKKKNTYKADKYVSYYFLLPALIFMLVFIGYPIIQNVILSFKNVDVITFANKGMQKFIGLDNYKELFLTPNALMPETVKNSLIFTIGSIFFQFTIGFAMALLFKKRFPGSRFFRSIIMISWIIPVTVTGLLFKFMFGLKGGIINQILIFLNLINEPIGWLIGAQTAMAAIVIANIWIGIPFNMILILTGLTTVPDEVYESAKIDGASKIYTFFKITVPMIKPALLSVLTLGFVFTFKVFDLVWVMTKGGPVNATDLVSTYAYKLSFEQFQFSKGAAAANVLLVILIFVGLLYVRVIKNDEEM